MDKRVWPGIAMIIAAEALLFSFTLSWTSLFVAAFILFAHMSFFRDPVRHPAEGDLDSPLSPADGTIDVIEEVEDRFFLNEPAYRVSIFLSIFNVHVTRSPVAGVIKYIRYVPGQFLNALNKESKDRNESNWIGIENEGKRVLVKQTVGAIARRIYCDVAENDAVERGQKAGIICYGSRVDCLIPKRLVKLTARLGDKVYAGQTRLGSWI